MSTPPRTTAGRPHGWSSSPSPSSQQPSPPPSHHLANPNGSPAFHSGTGLPHSTTTLSMSNANAVHHTAASAPANATGANASMTIPTVTPSMPGGGASIKHLEFQLQRERTNASNLSAKCKQLQTQVSQLEQEKAELRREKLALLEESKRVPKLEEHVAGLKRELEQREKRLSEAKAESEEIRRKAHSSIEQWTAAEARWMEAEAGLQANLVKQKEEWRALQQQYQSAKQSKEEMEVLLQREQERSHQHEKRCASLEADLRTQYEQLEQHRSKVFAFEKDKIDWVRDQTKLQEVLHQKEGEWKAQALELERQQLENEKLSVNIQNLMDRLNKEKSVQSELMRAKELLACDVSGAQKEQSRLTMLLESERKEKALILQRLEQAEHLLDELREKCTDLQDSLKEKRSELRQKDLEMSELHATLQHYESQTTQSQTERHRREKELDLLRRQLQETDVEKEQLEAEKTQLEEALDRLREALEQKAEELVVLRAGMEETEQSLRQEVQQLLQEVEARQKIIQQLHGQMKAMNQRQQQLHGHLTEESKQAERVAQERQHCEAALQAAQRELLLWQARYEKALLCAESEPMQRYGIVCAALLRSFHKEGALATERMERLQGMLTSMEAREADLTQALQLETAQHQSLSEQNELLQRTVEETTGHVQDLTTELARMQHECVELRSLVKALERRGEALQAEATAQREAAEVERSQALTAQEERRRDQQRREGLGALPARVLEELCVPHSHLLLRWMERKYEQVWASVTGHTERAWRELKSVRVQLSEAVDKSNGLEALLTETSQLLAEKQLRSEDEKRALSAKVQELEMRLGQTLLEKTQYESSVQDILKRWNAEKETWSATLAKQEHDAETVRSEMARELRKVREGIAYELRRKGEYKVAVDTLRQLRREEASARAEEQSLSSAAIQVANSEIAYWRKVYHQLQQKLQRYKARRKQAQHHPAPPKDEDEGLGRSKRYRAEEVKGLVETAYNGDPPLATDDEQNNTFKNHHTDKKSLVLSQSTQKQQHPWDPTTQRHVMPYAIPLQNVVMPLEEPSHTAQTATYATHAMPPKGIRTTATVTTSDNDGNGVSQRMIALGASASAPAECQSTAASPSHFCHHQGEKQDVPSQRRRTPVGDLDDRKRVAGSLSSRLTASSVSPPPPPQFYAHGDHKTNNTWERAEKEEVSRSVIAVKTTALKPSTASPSLSPTPLYAGETMKRDPTREDNGASSLSLRRAAPLSVSPVPRSERRLETSLQGGAVVPTTATWGRPSPPPPSTAVPCRDPFFSATPPHNATATVNPSDDPAARSAKAFTCYTTSNATSTSSVGPTTTTTSSLRSVPLNQLPTEDSFQTLKRKPPPEQQGGCNSTTQNNTRQIIAQQLAEWRYHQAKPHEPRTAGSAKKSENANDEPPSPLRMEESKRRGRRNSVTPTRSLLHSRSPPPSGASASLAGGEKPRRGLFKRLRFEDGV